MCISVFYRYGSEVPDHFRETTKMVKWGSGPKKNSLCSWLLCGGGGNIYNREILARNSLLSRPCAVRHRFFGLREHGCDFVRIADVKKHPLGELSRHLSWL